jgi:hypothetical protein
VDEVTSQPREEDEGILRDISDAVRHVGRVPEAVREAGLAVFPKRTARRGAVLASIDYDSLLDDGAQLRAPGGARVVTFDTGSLSIEVVIDEERLVGQLIPPAAGRVAILRVEGVVEEAVVDEMGRFVLPTPSPGPSRFRCQIGESEVFTDWMDLRPAPPPSPA